MSRELKLRGQRKANKEWVFGSLDWERDEYGYKRWYIHTGADGGFEEHYRVIPETVGQYTGLKDKNGKEIYEGDVVDFTVVTRTHIAAITWMPLSSQFGMSRYSDQYWDMTDRQDFITIIGNNHENPDLLER